MNINIPSNKYVELSKLSNVVDIETKVVDYKLQNGKLEGKVNFSLTYNIDSLDEQYKTEAVSKFSILVDNDYNIEKIECKNLEYEVIINNGVTIIFDVFVEYSNIDEISKIEEDVDNKLKDILSNREEKENILFDENILVEKENVECCDDIQSEKCEYLSDEILLKEDNQSNEEIIEDIIVEHENNLIKEEEVLLRNSDVKKEESHIEIIVEEDVQLEELEKEHDPKLIELEDTYSTYKVVFIKDEKKIEELATKYNKSVSEIYKDNDYNIENKVVIKLDE